jgi:hypothetical protein
MTMEDYKKITRKVEEDMNKRGITVWCKWVSSMAVLSQIHAARRRCRRRHLAEVHSHRSLAALCHFNALLTLRRWRPLSAG